MAATSSSPSSPPRSLVSRVVVASAVACVTVALLSARTAHATKTFYEIFGGGTAGSEEDHAENLGMLDPAVQSTYEQWKALLDSNSTRVHIATNAELIDMSDEMSRLHTIANQDVLKSFIEYGDEDLEYKILGRKPEFQNMTMQQIRTEHRVDGSRALSEYFNSYKDLAEYPERFFKMVDNLVNCLERLDVELHYIMRQVMKVMLIDEIERERMSALLGTPEFIEATTRAAIAKGTSSGNSSSQKAEIGAAAFIAVATFVLVLLNAVRFGLFFYKSRNTEKLVATDMTFASTD